jgi:hypothetical protein
MRRPAATAAGSPAEGEGGADQPIAGEPRVGHGHERVHRADGVAGDGAAARARRWTVRPTCAGDAAGGAGPIMARSWTTSAVRCRGRRGSRWCVSAGGCAGSVRYSAPADALSTSPPSGCGSKSGCGGGSWARPKYVQAVHRVLLTQRRAEGEPHPARADDDDVAEPARRSRVRHHDAAAGCAAGRALRAAAARRGRSAAAFLTAQHLALPVDRRERLAVGVRDAQADLRPLLAHLRRAARPAVPQTVGLHGGCEDGRRSNSAATRLRSACSSPCVSRSILLNTRTTGRSARPSCRSARPPPPPSAPPSRDATRRWRGAAHPPSWPPPASR